MSDLRQAAEALLNTLCVAGFTSRHYVERGREKDIAKIEAALQAQRAEEVAAITDIVKGYQLPEGWKMSRLDDQDATTKWLERIVARLDARAKEYRT